MDETVVPDVKGTIQLLCVRSTSLEDFAPPIAGIPSSSGVGD